MKLRTWKCAGCGKIGKEKEIKKGTVDTFDEKGNRFDIIILDEDELEEYTREKIFDKTIDEWILPLCNKCFKEFGYEDDDESEKAMEFFEKGCDLEDSNKLDEALKFYNKAIEMSSDCLEAYFQKAYVLEKQGEYTEALKTYDTAITTHPDFTQFQEEKANLLKIMAHR